MTFRWRKVFIKQKFTLVSSTLSQARECRVGREGGKGGDAQDGLSGKKTLGQDTRVAGEE